MVDSHSSAAAGFGLVEVVVAMTLLAICVMSVASGAAFSAGVLRRAEELEGASRAAGSVLDSLVPVTRAGSGAAIRERFEVQWQHDSAGLRIDVVGRGDPSHVLYTIRALTPAALDTVPCVTCQ